MSPLWTALGAASAGAGGAFGLVAWQARRRGIDRWILPHLAGLLDRPGPGDGPVHLMLAVADHYEPKWGGASPAVARSRVESWVERYPRLLGAFRDHDGRPPRHTFFYPADEYEPEYLDALAGLCRGGYGEVEVHLHHDGDTAENLRRTLLDYKETLAGRHGLLSRDRATGELAYGFVHGNWALDNSNPHGRWCGVDNELDVLRETGCYADFTMPSAPDASQTRKINSIYYATDDPARPKSHDTGVDVGLGPPPERSLMLIQGPLGLDWGRRKWGIVPRIENGCLQEGQPPNAERLRSWLDARVRVAGRPDWYFVKLYCHGSTEDSQRVLLDEPMARFHEELAERARRDARFHYHYVTAREMYNLVKAAEAGWTGDVDGARDFQLVPNGRDTSDPPAGLH